MAAIDEGRSEPNPYAIVTYKSKTTEYYIFNLNFAGFDIAQVKHILP
jgi:hypothetical protein